MQATLQSIYDAHKAAAPEAGFTVILVGRDVSETPYITGTSQDSSNEVEAVVRRSPEAPIEPVALDW
jgi:hypothetical protein